MRITEKRGRKRGGGYFNQKSVADLGEGPLFLGGAKKEEMT